ncbi:MAG: glycosyltransferase [Bacteroidota bacterium]
MKIVIEPGLTYNTDRALGIFTNELWQDLAILAPGHQFFLLEDEKNAAEPTLKTLPVQKIRKTGIRWLDQRQLNKTLTSLAADRFISPQPGGFCILTCSPEKGIAKRAAMAGRSVVFTGHTAGQTPGNSKPTPVITLVKPACSPIITSLSWTEAESVKTQYTGGRSFFLFIGNISEPYQLVALLKAFSIFKKWQQSNMQLVIAGYTTDWTEVFEEKLLHYKYRNDVVMIKNPASTEMAKLVAASYAVLYPATENVFPLGLVWALQSHKAIIAADSEVNRQLTTAAEWVDVNNTSDAFAKAMMLLYKDENRQQWLVQQTRQTAHLFNRRQMMTEVWQCIEK